MNVEQFGEALAGIGVADVEIAPLSVDSTYPGYRLLVTGPHQFFSIDLPKTRVLTFQDAFELIEARVLALESEVP